MTRFLFPVEVWISYIARSFLFGGAIYAFFDANYLLAIFILFSLCITFFPAYLEHNYRIVLPALLEVTFVLFVFAALFLGELNNFYDRFWWWDMFLHGLFGIIFGLLGFIALFTLFDQDRIRTSAFWVCFLSFCMALSLGALWEIGEFFSDIVFGTNLQKGITNTMIDLILDTLGALWVSVFGYLYIQHNHQNIVKSIIHAFQYKNPHFFNNLKDKVLESNTLAHIQEKKDHMKHIINEKLKR